MPIRTAIWKVAPNPEPLTESAIANEQLLETMIVAAPALISNEWMLIGRQEDTGFGGRIDLLAIAPDGSLVLIELKRNQTPREVVAQALDYASWVQNLKSEDIVAIYSRFLPGHLLSQDFQVRFGIALDEDNLNANHQIIIVAGCLDASTERIVGYLSERDIPINVLCFQVFSAGGEQLLSRSWLLDPVRTQINVAVSDKSNEPWNGEFYCSFGDEKSRSWEDAVRYGFISGGGGTWYSKTLQLLSPGDRVWVKVPGRGFVGVGRVTGRSQRATDFKVVTPQGEFPALSVLTTASHLLPFADDPDKSDYFVPVRWLDTVPLKDAIQEIGMFGNQNTVCKPTTPKWRSTVDRLKEKFPNFDQP